MKAKDYDAADIIDAIDEQLYETLSHIEGDETWQEHVEDAKRALEHVLRWQADMGSIDVEGAHPDQVRLAKGMIGQKIDDALALTLAAFIKRKADR